MLFLLNKISLKLNISLSKWWKIQLTLSNLINSSADGLLLVEYTPHYPGIGYINTKK